VFEPQQAQMLREPGLEQQRRALQEQPRRVRPQGQVPEQRQQTRQALLAQSVPQQQQQHRWMRRQMHQTLHLVERQ
jgi:hypothetical protein